MGTQQFLADEITQTTTDYSGGLPSASTILHFGHDAHGSVRVLFNAAATIAQVYTYAAYGELIALHNSFGSNVTSQASSLTSVLYNGESFDSRIGQLYLRARWYDMHRFTTLDPYSGNASDPLSFNKFGFVHANPVMGIDPTGKFFGSMVSMLATIAIDGGLRVEHSFANMNLLGDTTAEFDEGFALGWQYWQMFQIGVGAGALTIGSAAVAIDILSSTGLLTKTAFWLKKMLDIDVLRPLAMKITNLFSRAKFLRSANDFAGLAPELQDLVRAAYQKRASRSGGNGNVAAMHYEIFDPSTNTWIRQKPIAVFNDDVLHSESRLLEHIAGLERDGKRVRITALFTERAPCLNEGGGGCAADLVLQEGKQGHEIQLVSFLIETGVHAAKNVESTWRKILSSDLW